jgi:hypothetical protein
MVPPVWWSVMVTVGGAVKFPGAGLKAALSAHAVFETNNRVATIAKSARLTETKDKSIVLSPPVIRQTGLFTNRGEAKRFDISEVAMDAG